MKLVQDFNAFLNDTVNLNSTRFDQLESSIDAIKTAVRGLAEDNGVPVSWMRDPEELAAAQAQEAQAAQAMQLVEGAKVAGDAAKSLAEAQNMAAAA